MIEAGHLGGYVEGGDDATYYPALWSWLVKERGVRSVVDVGCGDGVALDHFTMLGCDAIGVEGVPQDHDLIMEHDYTFAPLYFDRKDLVWSCEFVEHVEEAFVPNFMASFKCADLLLMTHAMPGQAGYHHVNCQTSGYWIVRVEKETGLLYDHDLTLLTREISRENRSEWNHFARSGLAFQREESKVSEHERMTQGGTSRTETTETEKKETTETSTPAEGESGTETAKPASPETSRESSDRS